MASVKKAWIKKYGEEEGLKRWKELNRGKGTLKWYINKHGEVDGPIKYKEKNAKLGISERALRANGKTEEEILEIRSLHSKKSAQTLENMIKRYGKEEGEVRYRQYREKNRLTSNRRLDYWIDKCNGDVDLAKKSLSNWQKRDLNWYVNKYGDVDGLSRYNNSNRKKGRLLENYIKKYGNEDGLKKYINACKNWKNGQKGIFNSSGQLEVERYVRTLYSNVKGARNEVGIILTETEKSDILQNNTLYPDMIVNDKYIIRYNGDFWHANKSIFPDDNMIVGRVNKPAGVIRAIDLQKDRIYEKRGFVVINIWDSEWQTNKELVKKRIQEEIR